MRDYEVSSPRIDLHLTLYAFLSQVDMNTTIMAAAETKATAAVVDTVPTKGMLLQT